MSRMDARHCHGCRDDFYNTSAMALGGCCWNRKDAKVVVRFRIHRDLPTIARNIERVRVPNCYHAAGWSYMDELPSHVNPKEVRRG